MHNHQHGPQCQHGHGHGGHGGHGGGHGSMGFPGAPQQISNEEYFKELKKKYDTNRIFFWQQILQGSALDRLYEKYGLDFMRSFNCYMAVGIIGSLQSAISCEWVPNRYKVLTSSLFLPIVFLLLFNFNVVVGIGHDNLILRVLSWASLFFLLAAGLRGSGQLNNSQTKQRCRQIYSVRPYLQNPNAQCRTCGILRFYRSMHCPMSKTCVAKYSRFSVVLGGSIGAANEILTLLFFLCFWASLLLSLWLFYSTSSYGFITKLLFYFSNGVLCWMSFTEWVTLLIINIYYGLTEAELKQWMSLPYLLRIPEREFQNNITQGFFGNLIDSIYAMLGLSGFQSQFQAIHGNPLGFKPLEQGKSFRVNWALARFHMIPHIPTHKKRAELVEMLSKEQPRMIEMYKLQSSIREEVLKQAGTETLNQMQIQQKMAIKMQAHMMKSGGPMHMQQPSQDQQRAIQLQMLGHMKKEFSSQPDLQVQIVSLLQQLQNSKVTPIEANLRMRQLQQQLMQRRMAEAMKQQQQLKKRQAEQQQSPMAKIADEDL